MLLIGSIWILDVYISVLSVKKLGVSLGLDSLLLLTDIERYPTHM